MVNKKHTYVGVYDTSTDNFYNIYKSDASIKELKELQENKVILPGNSIIISSPVDGNFSYDNNTPAIAVTDSYGGILPLTYSFNPKYFSINEENNSVQFSENVVNELNFTNTTEYKELQKKFNTLANNFNSLIKSKINLIINDSTYTIFFNNECNISVSANEIKNAKILNNFTSFTYQEKNYTAYTINILPLNGQSITLSNIKNNLKTLPLTNDNLCITFNIDIYNNTYCEEAPNIILCETNESNFYGYVENPYKSYTPGIETRDGYLNIYLGYVANHIPNDTSYVPVQTQKNFYNSFISGFNCLSFLTINDKNRLDKVNIINRNSYNARLNVRKIYAYENVGNYIDVDVLCAAIPISNITNETPYFDFSLQIPSYLNGEDSEIYFESNVFDLRIWVNSIYPEPITTPTIPSTTVEPSTTDDPTSPISSSAPTT